MLGSLFLVLRSKEKCILRRDCLKKKSWQKRITKEDYAPRARENESETPVSEPAVEPSTGSARTKVPGVSRTENYDNTYILKARAKIMLGKWLLLPLEEKVANEQSTKVFDALDSICRVCSDFSTFCETAKTDLETLVGKFKHDDPLCQTPDVLPGLEAELAQAKGMMEAQARELAGA
ncbi:hypothetical protein Pyn_03643 [Prunus yedoensis var. nudiflora]|uniref:Uncharacterized protein n=1 Tax=Prunus yedoensis var. nudiflora TaxID=2094558 RepID=A0A314ZN01_PRUYE|nr:hypothetical protein Pyn_03643 [Prunus yedoensis var. nudiflora]